MSDDSNTQEDIVQNDHLVLISGASATGKSACLMGLKDPEGVMYLNCESKKLPFKSKFDEYRITDPLEIIQGFEAAEQMPHIHTIVVDTLTFLMDMFESTYVVNSSNTMKGWSDYAQFLRNLMLQTVAKSTKNVIFLAHTRQIMNESEMVLETKVPVKGSLANAGVEAFFSTVISTKKVPLKQLKATNSLLEITPEEEALGFKYVFQTRLTKETVNERIRSPLKMWSADETFIDNNLQYVIDRLHEYYD
jgi:hypothetical protein